ncbi:MAG: PD-(D/E)XK nuclease family protein [Lachnospiraceae bacterium]|nr:PD-(D/E)XK nuclease family protein [Lachnospiraceae bacterium]
MGLLKIVLGPAGSGKTDYIYRDLISRSEKNYKKNYIVIVPEQSSHAATGEILKRSRGHGILNIDVLGFTRFAHRIFSAAGENKKTILDDTGKNLILRRIASEKKDDLKVLKKNINRQGYISEIKSVISEYIQYEIDADSIIEEASKRADKNYLAAKAEDIAVLYKAFREKIGTDYITNEEILDLAGKSVEKADFLKGASIYFDDFTGFTPIQYRFIEQLMHITEDCSVALNYDGFSDGLFAMSVQTIANLREIAHNSGWKCETVNLYDNKEVRAADKEDLRFLEKNIFRKKKKIFEAVPEHIKLVNTPDPMDEAAFVCSKIHEAVCRGGLRYRDCAVVMSNVETYASALEREADKYGIPLFIDSSSSIELNPFVEFLRAALEIEIENYSFESVMHFLRTGISGFSIEDIDIFENYIKATNMRGRKKYANSWTRPVRTLDADELERINALREKLKSYFESLDEVMTKRNVTAFEYTEALRKFSENLDVREKLEKLSEEFEENAESRRAQEYSQIYDKLEELFDRIENLIAEEKMTLRQYLEILNSGLDEIRVGAIPPGLDRVNAGDMTRSRLQNIKILFFMGMNEGLIPSQNTGSGLLSDFDREYLKEQGIKLSLTAREKIREERLYFYMSVTKPSEMLYLSWSDIDAEGKGKRESYFLNVVKKLFPKAELIESDNERIGRELMNENDALKRLSLGLKNNDDKETVEIYRYFASLGNKDQILKNMLDSVFFDYRSDPISKAAAGVIFGHEKYESPSKLEKFALCAYEHFLRYGLKLKEREEFGFERKDMGLILHSVLEMYSGMLQEKGLTFSDLTDEESLKLTEEALEKYLNESDDRVLRSSKRNEYFIIRLDRILRRTVKTLTHQAKSGSFKTSAFEKEFYEEGFRGRIDRIDTAEKDSKIYVSIIDYKSGNKTFDLSRIYYGLDLQLVIYMNAAMKIEKIAHPSLEVKPAGIFYYHIDDPEVRAEDLKEVNAEEAEKSIRGELKLRGIVNADSEVIRLFDSEFESKSDIIPVSVKSGGDFAAAASVLDEDGFGVAADYVRFKSGEFKKSIEDGNITKSPVEYKNISECDYCDYRDVCLFDEKKRGYKKRKLKEIKERSEIIELMKTDMMGEDQKKDEIH